MRRACNVVFDAESQLSADNKSTGNQKPRATFAGFLNQTEISKAYVAADVMVLPSDYGETWGLVVNEATTIGLPCIVSDRCGCAEDLGRISPNTIFPCGNLEVLARQLHCVGGSSRTAQFDASTLDDFSLRRTVETVHSLYGLSATASHPSVR